jgi:hypothetical protein
MKVRLRHHSVRVRLTKSEVDALGQGHDVVSVTGFGSDNDLEFRLVAAAQTQVRASMHASRIVIAVPVNLVQRWYQSDEVSIEAAQPISEGTSLAILIEKDFACLTPRPGGDDDDCFSHPGAKA